MNFEQLSIENAAKALRIKELEDALRQEQAYNSILAEQKAELQLQCDTLRCKKDTALDTALREASSMQAQRNTARDEATVACERNLRLEELLEPLLSPYTVEEMYTSLADIICWLDGWIAAREANTGSTVIVRGYAGLESTHQVLVRYAKKLNLARDWLQKTP